MPPHVLFVHGEPAALVPRRRWPSSGPAGQRRRGGTAARIATALVAADATVVSGLAFGIDGAAHEAAVRAGWTTVAVIGGGHAVSPRAHARLAAAIVAAGGAVVSELPPDVEPAAARSRDATGSSAACGRHRRRRGAGPERGPHHGIVGAGAGPPCFLVPGALAIRHRRGVSRSCASSPEGARIVAGVPQLIDDLGLADHLTEPGVPSKAAATLADVGPAPGRIGRELVLGRATVDELVAATGWPVASVLAALTLLERRGLAAGFHGRFGPPAT